MWNPVEGAGERLENTLNLGRRVRIKVMGLIFYFFLLLPREQTGLGPN